MAVYTKIFIKFPCRFWTEHFYTLMYKKTNYNRFNFWQHIPNSNENICPKFTNDADFKNFNYTNYDNKNFSLFLTTLVNPF